MSSSLDLPTTGNKQKRLCQGLIRGKVLDNQTRFNHYTVTKAQESFRLKFRLVSEGHNLLLPKCT